MSNSPENKKGFLKKLRHRYRLVIMNDDTFEESISLRLTPMGFLIMLISITIVMTIIVTSIIAFTPVREYIPGYADVGLRRDLIRLAMRSDSIEKAVIARNDFNENIENILSGKLKTDTTGSRPDKNKNSDQLDIGPSAAEKDLKNKVESADKYSLNYESAASKTGISNFFFFTPIRGIVTASFKSEEQHFGVDITAPENEAIKSTLDGTVVLATWSSETGYTITIQHTNNLISVYKHNSVLLKKPGDYVKAGEPIAIIGNSGEQSTGPHLHFELWYNGTAVDPQTYMVF